MRTTTGGQLVSIKAWLQQTLHANVGRGVLLEPALRLGRIRGLRRQLQRRPPRHRQLLEHCPALAQWLGPHVDVVGGQEVEGQEGDRWEVPRRPTVAAVGQSSSQGPEVEPAVPKSSRPSRHTTSSPSITVPGSSCSWAAWAISGNPSARAAPLRDHTRHPALVRSRMAR
jgi:hypothetical protein